MFNSGMQETKMASIQLKGVSSQGLKEVIDFIYSGELKLSLNVSVFYYTCTRIRQPYAIPILPKETPII
jgi:hypothetical protein